MVLHVPAPGDDRGRLGHLFPGSRHLAQWFGQQQEGVLVQRGDLRVLRIQFAQVAHAGVVEQGARFGLAGIAHGDQAVAVQCSDGHVDGMRDAMTPPGLFHRAHHAGQRRDRVFLQAERQRQQEHHLGIHRGARADSRG
ncbi:hypothetical protein G6F24_016281 [Rhizopus arrhizus]|nr:hypothetical protein G6F24_016281 [Rhizopus arrhizus]